jgi:hypothetical protein
MQLYESDPPEVQSNEKDTNFMNPLKVNYSLLSQRVAAANKIFHRRPSALKWS